MKSVALTIAGSDPSGGAGLQADLKTFHQHGVYGMSVIAPVAAKTGALGSAATIEAVAHSAATFGFPLVVDPVMVSKHGDPLIDRDAANVLRTKLLPHALLVTPNMFEAAALAEMDVFDLATMEKAAGRIALGGARHVLVKGGRLEGQCVDVLWSDGEIHRFSAARADTNHTHGSGCVYSAAITARLARGEELTAAIQGAKAFISEAIRTAPQLGAGHGPTNMHASG